MPTRLYNLSRSTEAHFSLYRNFLKPHSNLWWLPLRRRPLGGAALLHLISEKNARFTSARGDAGTGKGVLLESAEQVGHGQFFFLSRPWLHLYEENIDPATPSWLNAQHAQYARQLFSLRVFAHPVLVAQTIHRLPLRAFPQIAIVGHSNAGKSSLVNGLLGGREVARTSKTPGRTRQLFTFDLANELSLVDLPGYGFAKVSQEMKNDWAVLVEEYLSRSKQLKRVLSLVDLTAGIRSLDERLWRLLIEKKVPFQVIATKADLMTTPQLHARMQSLISALQTLGSPLVYPFLFAISSKRNLGMPELRCCLSDIALQYRLNKLSRSRNHRGA